MACLDYIKSVCSTYDIKSPRVFSFSREDGICLPVSYKHQSISLSNACGVCTVCHTSIIYGWLQKEM